MREDMFSRTESLIGREALENLKKVRVAVFGLGGVGGYAAEALARSGIGALDIIDKDRVSESNINRQIMADANTLGQVKVELMKSRLESINPNMEVRGYHSFFLPGAEQDFHFSSYDYIIDAVDTVAAKIELVMIAEKYDIPMISSMGTGNKLCPELLEVADIYDTSICPLAKVMRKELRKRGIKKLRVVYSKEEPLKSSVTRRDLEPDRSVSASMIFVPASAGLLLAREAVTYLGRFRAN